MERIQMRCAGSYSLSPFSLYKTVKREPTPRAPSLAQKAPQQTSNEKGCIFIRSRPAWPKRPLQCYVVVR